MAIAVNIGDTVCLHSNFFAYYFGGDPRDKEYTEFSKARGIVVGFVNGVALVEWDNPHLPKWIRGNMLMWFPCTKKHQDQ